MKTRIWFTIVIIAFFASGCPVEEEWDDTNNQNRNNENQDYGDYNNRNGNNYDSNNDYHNDGNNEASSEYCDRPAPNQQVMLPITPMQQWCSQWCWAAVSTSISNYLGTQMTDSYGQSRPARECYLASVNGGFRDWSACCFAQACQSQGCNRPVAWSNMDDALAIVGLNGRVVQRPLTEQEIRHEIANGRPIVVGVQGTGIGHVAMITGYTPGNPFIYQLDDPWPYSGMGSTRFQLTYRQILNGPDGQSPWFGSWYRLSGRPDGCVPSVNPDCSCPTEDDTDPPPACGDGVCESGENNCPEDCAQDPVCGDGICDDRETDCPSDCESDSEPICGDGVCEAVEENVCEQDCDTQNTTCNDPDYPISCDDGRCWSEGTNCETDTFTCNGNVYKCRDTLEYANCCNGKFYTCGPGYPYFCPTDDLCYADASACPESVCEYRGLTCEQVL